MQYWIRQAALTIGRRRFTLDGLNFTFKITFEDRPKMSTATLEVYNLAPATRAEMAKGDQIILSAGYKGDVGTIFIGAIADFVHNINDLDVVTKIVAADSMDAWLARNVNKTYKAGMYAADILDDLLAMFGVEVGLVKLAVNKFYPGCKVCKGKLKDVLTQIVCSDCKSRLVIRTGKIIINPPNEGINTGYLLNPQTGLLKAASQAETQDIGTTAKATAKTRSQQTEADGKKTRTCLLNYHIGVADKIVIQDNQLNGTFLVTSGMHEGSRTGSWQTTLEVKPA